MSEPWTFWKRRTIASHQTGTRLLDRLHLVNGPLGGVMLHWHHGPDEGRSLHDHPWSFVSVILRGGYIELAGRSAQIDSSRWLGTARGLRRVRWMAAEDAHRIIAVNHGTLSLVVHGPKRRVWGFWTPVGWVAHYAYEAAVSQAREVDLDMVPIDGAILRWADLYDEPLAARYP